MDRGLFYLSLFLIVAGAAAAAAGTILRIRREREKEYEGETKAKVVDLLLKEDDRAVGGYRNKYYPVLQYYAGGKLCEVVYEKGAYPAAWKIGQTVRIEYDPKDPTLYRIKTYTGRDLLPGGLYAGGFAMMVLGAILFLKFAMR